MTESIYNLDVAFTYEAQKFAFHLNNRIAVMDEYGTTFAVSTITVEVNTRGGVSVYGFGAPGFNNLDDYALNIPSAWQVLQALVPVDERASGWGLRFLAAHGSEVVQ